MSKDIAQTQTGAFTARFWPNEKKGLAIRPALVYDLHQESKNTAEVITLRRL